ncbi:MAG: hypothetical protein QHJ74_10945 [Anaerolineae bacterium]|nr:hypothetical protein [Anaerolineae bacterium]
MYFTLGASCCCALASETFPISPEMVGAVSYRATPVTTVGLRGAGVRQPRYGKRGYPNFAQGAALRRAQDAAAVGRYGTNLPRN